MKLKKNKYIIYFFLTIILFKPLWLFESNSIEDSGDDISYWLHSATIAFDFDIEYIDDFKSDKVLVNNITNTPIHYPGSGYLSSPFVFLFSMIDNFFSNKIDRLNPTGSFAYLGYFFSSLFYTYLGYYLILKTIKANNFKIDPGFLFLSFIGTLVHFSFTRFLMSHSIEFFLCSLLIYLFTRKNFITKDSEITYIILVYFLLLITRPSTFLYSLMYLLIFKNKFKLKIFYTNYISIFAFALLTNLYVNLSVKLYQSKFFFLSNYGIQAKEYQDSLNLITFFNGIQKFPNLIFSTNMGVIWTFPILVFALIAIFKLSERFKVKLYYLIYIFSSLSVLFIWQGREISYGQRLLIGIIPICIYLIAKVEIKFSFYLYPVMIWTYLGYLYFYSSKLLTLTKGVNLWGKESLYTASNYFQQLLSNLFNIENLGYIFTKNIFSINFFNLISFENIPLFIFNFVPASKISDLQYIANLYFNIDKMYLLISTLLIMFFSYKYAKLITN